MSKTTTRGPVQIGAWLPTFSGLQPHELDPLTDEQLARTLYFTTGKPDGYIRIGTATVTLALDSREEVARTAVATLRAQQTKVRADAEAAATRIEAQIQSILALEA